MESILKAGAFVAKVCKGDGGSVTILVVFEYIFFTFLEAAVEELIFGERFVHWLDLVFWLLFASFYVVCLYGCYVLNEGEGGEP